MKQFILAWRYFLAIIMLLGVIAALIMCIWAAITMPVLGGIVGAAWWVFRIVSHQIDSK